MMEKGGATAGDPYFSSVSLLLNGEAFTDLSTNALTVYPEGNASIVSGQGPFGGAAMSFDGVGDYLTIPANNVFEFGSSDFTWEFWIKTTATAQYTTVYSRTPSDFSGGMWTLMLNWSSSSAGDIALYMGDYSGGSPLLQTDAVNLCNNAWHFVSVSRSGSAWSIAIDGTSRVSAAFSGSIAALSAANYIGRDQRYIRDFDGLIGPLRITKGIARSVTVPTGPFPTA
jgi:sialidase-1